MVNLGPLFPLIPGFLGVGVLVASVLVAIDLMLSGTETL